MNEKIFDSAKEMGDAIAEEICALAEKKTKKSAPLICLAAGHSSLPVFEALIQRKEQGFDFSAYGFVSMDEWAGMNDKDAESCGGFLRKNLLDALELNPGRVRLFDGRSPGPQAECESVERFIARHGGIDFMLLGIGMNGHLALNEPGCKADGGAHYTELSETTKNTGQKYFSRPAALTGGLSLGLGNIRSAAAIVVTVNGAHKSPVVKRLRESAADDMSFPASALKNLPHARFYFDAEAAGDIRYLG